MNLRAGFSSIILGLLLTACGNEQIDTYKIPKEMPEASGMSAEGLESPSPQARRELSWKKPASWREQAASAMRLGSFLYTGENGQQADISVVQLSGEAGGDLPNINRWRGQIQLDPIGEEQLRQESRLIQPAGRKMLFVDFASREPLIAGRYKKRVTAAIYKAPQGATWFFKMIGEDETVKAAESAFLLFLQSLKFRD